MDVKSINIEKILLVLAAYGIIQVLAQDLGIKTGKKQRDLVQSMPVQLALLYASGWAVTSDHQTAGIATGLYYFLKYGYSGGENSTVCLEGV